MTRTEIFTLSGHFTLSDFGTTFPCKNMLGPNYVYVPVIKHARKPPPRNQLAFTASQFQCSAQPELCTSNFKVFLCRDVQIVFTPFCQQNAALKISIFFPSAGVVCNSVAVKYARCDTIFHGILSQRQDSTINIVARQNLMEYVREIVQLSMKYCRKMLLRQFFSDTPREMKSTMEKCRLRWNVM